MCGGERSRRTGSVPARAQVRCRLSSSATGRGRGLIHPASILVVVLTDTRGEAIPFALVAMTELRRGALTDARGLGRIDQIPPGFWTVRWNAVGAPPDSTRIQFERGRAETLEVRVKFRSEVRRNEAAWDGRLSVPRYKLTSINPSRQPVLDFISGRYANDAASETIEVGRVGGSLFRLNSSSGWEGVGILNTTRFEGVSLYCPEPCDGPGDFAHLSIDWARPEQPDVVETFPGDPTKRKVGRWRRLSAEGADSASSRSPRPASPSIEASPGRRPALGEYVYVDELPEAVYKVPPADPGGGVEGTVLLQALVVEDGTVDQVTVVKSIPELDAAAMAAVRQWRFKPARAGGKPVAVWVAVPLVFGAKR